MDRKYLNIKESSIDRQETAGTEDERVYGTMERTQMVQPFKQRDMNVYN